MIEIPDSKIEMSNLSGLKGRLLELDGREDARDVDMLIVSGVHTSLERMYTTAQFHSNFGRVWMPDLPGFGGMDSFYKIGLEPSIDNYADYLYTFMKTYKLDKRKIRLFAMSFGFLVATRMLQKHPQMTKNVEFVISFVGFGKTSDFDYAAIRNPFNKLMVRFGSTRFGSKLIKTLVFNKFSLKLMFWVFRLFNPKYDHDNEHDRNEAIDMELDLWSSNDARTRFYTYKILMDVDLTKDSTQLDARLYDITTPKDQYFNHKSVSETLKQLYKNTSIHKANMKLHAPSVISNEDSVAKIYPDSIKKVLAG